MISQQLDYFLDSSARFIRDIDTPVNRSEVIRYLGYPPDVSPSPQFQEALDIWVENAKSRATPRASFRILPVTKINKRSLQIQLEQKKVSFKGAIGEFLGPSQFIAAFVATAGVGVENLASQLMKQGDDLAAMIVNAVGAERAEAAEAKVMEQLRAESEPAGLAPTLPYSPGYCGMNLTEQQTLFSLFEDEEIGVTLSSSCLMFPIKSVSGLIGLGASTDIVINGSPCDRCKMKTCAMRR